MLTGICVKLFDPFKCINVTGQENYTQRFEDCDLSASSEENLEHITRRNLRKRMDCSQRNGERADEGVEEALFVRKFRFQSYKN